MIGLLLKRHCFRTWCCLIFQRCYWEELYCSIVFQNISYNSTYRRRQRWRAGISWGWLWCDRKSEEACFSGWKWTQLSEWKKRQGVIGWTILECIRGRGYRCWLQMVTWRQQPRGRMEAFYFTNSFRKDSGINPHKPFDFDNTTFDIGTVQTPNESKPDSENADDEFEKPEDAYFNKKVAKKQLDQIQFCIRLLLKHYPNLLDQSWLALLILEMKF